MDRSRRAPLALPRVTLVPLAALAVVGIACTPPSGECQSYGDCPNGQFCQEGTCVGDGLPDAGTTQRDSGPGPIPRDSGPGPDGGMPDGGTPGDDDVQVRTTFDVPWLQVDPDDPGRLLFAEIQESGGTVNIDRVRALRTDTLRIVTSPVFDLTTLASGPCLVDSVVVVAEAEETWFNCDLSPGVRILFDVDQIAQPGNTDALSAHVVHVVPGPNTGVDFTRVLVAARGGSLRAWQLRPTDGVGQQRFTDTFGTAVDGVINVFDMEASGVPGMHVVVHDANTSRLVPLTRNPGAETWTETVALDAFALPAETHVAWVFGPIAANGDPDDPDEPNVITIEPSTGLARFWNFEQGQPLLPDTQFETDVQHLGPKPAASERLLLAPSPSGDFLFYTRADADKIYRIPLAQGGGVEPGGEELVRHRLLDDTSHVISSLVAVDDDTVWVSYANDNLIERLTVDEQP